MSKIRDFCNADLPGLARVWSDHWSQVDIPPPISASIIERALLSRSFFEPNHLLVAEQDSRVEAWCQWNRTDPCGPAEESHETVVLSAICFSQAGLESCDDLLTAAETDVRASGHTTITVGPLRDDRFGYVGLPPIGHGIGIPETDVRVASLLTRHGYSPQGSYSRLVVPTAPYRAPVNREMMQLRRTTRTETCSVMPNGGRQAAAMSHLDIENHILVNHRSGEHLASLRLWLSDPDSQVMSCSEAILDLTPIDSAGCLTAAESFLIAAVIRTLANRCIFQVETAVDSEDQALVGQLEALSFRCTQRGRRWRKELT
ncbi:MAG: hypothetical protein AAFU85_19930 [Planctomycetota bacterium]